MMIKTIELKNFRSIEKTKIDFDSPLKVLIGENGTGKTNVLLALKFISHCIALSPLRAIQNAGGLDQIFRIKERRTSECSFSITVHMPDRSKTHVLGGHLLGGKQKNIEESYANYKFSLKYVESKQQLRVGEEVFAYGKNEDCKEVIFDRSKSDLYLDIWGEFFDFPDLAFDSLFIHYLTRPVPDKEKTAKALANLVHLFLCEIVNMTGFNFSPHILRKTSDLLGFEFGYNGQNFSGFWNKLQHKKYPLWGIFRSRYAIKPKNVKRVLDDIKESYEEILPFLKEIKTDVGLDSTNVTLSFQEEHLNKKFYGVNHLSDGSIKFLALCVAISMSNYTFLYFEEIENYLNPKAIAFLFEMMRDYSKELDVQFLLTTHSETVLNFCEPKEVIISKRKNDGSTHYVKPKNLDTLNGELEEGGFGLGTYWSSGGIEVG